MVTTRSLEPIYLGLPGARLFDRIPETLFNPLGSKSHRQYWKLLCVLYQKRFGPEAPLPPIHGYPIREIVADVEECLEIEGPLEDDEVPSGADETPTSRASSVFRYLASRGWFQTEKHGVIETVMMAPAVRQLLANVIQFAETGPVFVSGKIRSIDINLRLVLSGEAAGDTLIEAADQSRNLLEHVRNTGTNVRDIMASISRENSTAIYVQRFFNDYVERVFIGDYKELRTTEHPFSKLHEILSAVDQLHETEVDRQRLITWYVEKRASGDHRLAEFLFERDLDRIRELTRIEPYLRRLDEEIRSANHRALAVFDYHLRSLKPVDHLVKNAIHALLQGRIPATAYPFAPGHMVNAQLLAEPKQQRVRPPAAKLRKTVVSDHQIALSRLIHRATERRMVTTHKIAEYVIHQLDGRASFDSQDAKQDSIESVRMFQTLSMVALQYSAKSRHVQMEARGVAPGLEVQFNDRPAAADEPVDGPGYTVIPRRKAKKKEAS